MSRRVLISFMLAVAAVVFLGSLISFGPSIVIKNVAFSDGFLVLRYSSPGNFTVRLLGPGGVLGSGEMTAGEGELMLKLMDENSPPSPGTYTVEIRDGGRVVSSKEIDIPEPAVEVVFRGLEWGWDEIAEKSTIRSVSFTVADDCGIPVYISSVVGLYDGMLVGGEPTEWKEAGRGDVGRWVAPGEEAEINAELDPVPLTPGLHGLILTVYWENTEVGRQKFLTAMNVPSFQMPSWREIEKWTSGL